MSQLPKGWVETKLINVGNTVTGNTPARKNPEFYGDCIPFVKPGDIDVDKEIYQTEESLSELGGTVARVLKKGSVLVTCIGNIGRVGLAMKSMATNQQINAVEFNELILPKYAFYYCRTLSGWLNFHASATTVAIINKSKFSEAPFKLAPLAEQTRIVEKLDEVLAQVDTIKARLDGIPAILKRFRQSVLAAAVSGKLITVAEPLRVKFGDVVTDIRYGTSKKCDYKGGLTPVIRIPNIGDRKLDITDLKSADFTEKELKTLALRTGDLLVIRSNGSLDLVAKPALVDKEYEGFLYAGYLIRIRCNQEKVLPKFLLNVLSSRVVRDVVELGARSTSGVNNINSKEIASLEFILPTIQEQKEIVRLVDQYFAFADTIEAQVKKAQVRVDKLTQSILAKAFRGELVAQDPNDEPADKLLERIAAARKEADALAKAAKKAGRKAKATA